MARTVLNPAAALACLALCGCLGLDGKGGGGDSRTREGRLHGYLVDAAGRPLAHSRVQAVPAHADTAGQEAATAKRTADSALAWTDDEGRYVFDSLAAGEYNLMADFRDGSLAAFIPEVRMPDSAVALGLGTDTLRAPGSVRGRVSAGGKGLGGAFCYLPGSSYLAISGDSGRFTISKVPKGRYTVRFSAPGYRIASDTGVAVASGRVTTLAERGLEAERKGNPAPPTRVEARYDSLRARIHLHWAPPVGPDVAGFLVYRFGEPGANPELLTDEPVTAPAFTDNVLGHLRAGETRIFIYRIRTVDRDANIGREYSYGVTVRAQHPDVFAGIDSMGVRGGREEVISIGDTLRLLVAYRNPLGMLAGVQWWHSLVGGDWRLLERNVPVGREGVDSLTWADTAAGHHVFKAVAVDDSGGFDSLYAKILVVPDPPLVAAGPDLIVSISDTVRLAGSGQDRFGAIVRWEWSIDSPGFHPASRPETTFVAPRIPGTVLRCVLKAVDDDGQEGLDTVWVSVIADPPVPRISAPIESRPGDTLVLSGEGSRDGYGRIVEWAWRVGASGAFKVTQDPTFRLGVPAQSGSEVLVSLRVTDDDGMTAVQSDTILIREASQWRHVWEVPYSDFAVRRGYGFHQGRFWMLMEEYTPTGGLHYGLWHTDDMFTWQRIPTDFQVPEGYTPLPTIHSLSGKLYIFLAQDGSDGGGVLPRVSEDGRTWTELPEVPGVAEAGGAGVAVFKDRLWLHGGYYGGRYVDTIWSSTDGRNWTAAQAAYGRKYQPSFTVHDGQLLLLGAPHTFQPKNELWRSADGTAWVKVQDTLPPSVEPIFRSLVSHQGRLLILDSRYEISPGWPEPVALTSPDGRTWTPFAGIEKIPNRLNSSFFEFKGRLWMVGTTDLNLASFWQGPP